MKITLFYTLIILGVISIGTAYAEGSLISVQTDDNNYSEKDTIVISGEIATIIGDTQVTMQLFQGANLIEIAQIKVSQDGNYSHRINAEGPLWTNQGTYMVKVTYGEANVAETLFEYTPKADIIEITGDFQVDAGDSGTFDLKYTIIGGVIESIDIEPKNLGLGEELKRILKDDGCIVLVEHDVWSDDTHLLVDLQQLINLYDFELFADFFLDFARNFRIFFEELHRIGFSLSEFRISIRIKRTRFGDNFHLSP